MLEILRTSVEDPGFVRLVERLDEELALRDGEEHSFYAQYNSLDPEMSVVVAKASGEFVGCGAFKPFDEKTVEIKRMFVSEDHRGQRIGSKVLTELESWAVEAGYSASVLETGLKQPEAIRLYENSGYRKIENFGQYKGIENSVCFGKSL